MELKTKYNIGDKVCAVTNEFNVIDGEISTIWVHILPEDYLDMTYWLSVEGHEDHMQFKESQLFTSREEIINRIKS